MAEPKQVKEATGFPGDADYVPGEWTALTEDEGYSVEFPDNGGEFFGTFTGAKELPLSPADLMEAEKNGKPTTWTMLTFTDSKGERCNMPANYRLQQALDAGLKEGQEVKIVHHGMKDLGGGQTLNRMSVYVKR
jgi:hypothetical protein